MFRTGRWPLAMLVPALAVATLVLPALPFSTAPKRVGPDGEGGYLVPTLETVHPAGDVVVWSGRPVDMVRAATGDLLFVKDQHGLTLVNTKSNTVQQELPVPQSGGTSMHGIACTRDGRHVYLTTAASELVEATISGTGGEARATWTRRISLPAPSQGKSRGVAYGCGIALSKDERTACVCLSRANSLALVDIGANRVTAEIPVGIAPYGVLLSPDGRTAYVSDWGGRHAEEKMPVAESAGTPTRIDARGIASEGCVSVVDLTAKREAAQVGVGLHPGDMVRTQDGSRLFVANANSDTVSVLETFPSEPAKAHVIETISAHPGKGMPFGSMPDALALNADGTTLYVANGGNNTVLVIALATSSANTANPSSGNREGSHSKLRGLIPTGWYPGAIALDDQRLYIANIKGYGSRGRAGKIETPGTKVETKLESKPETKADKRASISEPGWSVYDYLGNVNSVPLADIALDAETGAVPEALRRYTVQVRADSHIDKLVAPSTSRRAGKNGSGNNASGKTGRRSDRSRNPLPERDGDPSPIRHVVYVLKENRTYDQVLGDMAQGNGDPQRALYGREVTPNHHALAEQFVLLDNYYCNGVLSADGHSWATEGNCTDHLEKAFGGFARSYTFGDDPLTYSSSGFLWDRVLAKGLTFRNFGEMDYADSVPRTASYADIYRDFVTGTHTIRFTHNIGIANLRRHSDPDYPGWNLRIPDVLRADSFRQALHQYERTGKFPNLTLIYLPNDHTSGTAPGGPTPRAQVADNDLALGRIVHALSNSSFWPHTCIFVNEDDPQDGADHVDGHRSLCLVIGPYVRRGAVVHEAYNQTAALHTMERLLGVPPMNQKDAMAPLMRACFNSKPDFRPYTVQPNRIPLDEHNPKLGQLKGARRHWAEVSMHLDLSHPDAVEDETMNQILGVCEKK